MCEDGLFELFPVEAVYGMHNQPGLPLGKFGVRVGPSMASADMFDIKFLARVRMPPTRIKGRILL